VYVVKVELQYFTPVCVRLQGACVTDSVVFTLNVWHSCQMHELCTSACVNRKYNCVRQTSQK